MSWICAISIVGRLGQVARRQLRARIRQVWPDVTGMRVLGLGYATPYLRPFLGEAERVFALMPASQGVLPWPAGETEPGGADGRRRTAAAGLFDRPRAAGARARIQRAQPRAVERGVARAGGRRAAAGVRAQPARPVGGQFQHAVRPGQSLFAATSSRVCCATRKFTPERSDAALFVPPATRSRMMLRSAGAFERIGARWFNRFGGVVMIEATKQLYRPAAERAEKRRAVYVPANAPLVPGR